MSGGALRLKYDRAKRAGQSYVHDQIERTEAAAVSYLFAAGLYAAAGVFLIAALLVGATALFRWIEIRYGLFQAFAATGGLFVALTALCALFAVYRTKRPAKRIIPLASRLRVAIGTLPSDTSSITKVSGPYLPNSARRGTILTGLVIAASVMGWALVRRRTQQ